MTAFNHQIVAAYETCEVTPEEIAEQFGIELETVKIALLQSPKYRESIKQGEEEDVTQDEYKAILHEYKSLAFSTRDDGVKEKSLRFLINEKKGRNSTNAALLKGSGVVFNILQINASIAKTRQQLAKLLPDELKSKEEEFIQV